VTVLHVRRALGVAVLNAGHAARMAALDIGLTFRGTALNVCVTVRLRKGHRVAASVAHRATLDCRMATAVAAATAARVHCSAAAVTASFSAVRTGRSRCGDRQGGHTCSQNEPGHDKKLPWFQDINENVGIGVPATKFASSATGCALAQ
jgi:hypothetical protein